jgi:uncharacterized membrane protein
LESFFVDELLDKSQTRMNVNVQVLTVILWCSLTMHAICPFASIKNRKRKKRKVQDFTCIVDLEYL